MFERVLLCLDGSPLAEQAVPHAVALAARFGSRLIFFQVVAPYHLVAESGGGFEQIKERYDALEENARAYLERLAARHGRGLRAEAAAVKGLVPEAIIEYARQNNIDLVVITTHGETGLKRLVFGSVADALMRNFEVPVLLIKPRPTGA